jgi:chemotaxis protein MotB
MKVQILVSLALSSMLAVSCVSSKKFKAEQQRYVALETRYVQVQSDLTSCNDQKNALSAQNDNLRTEMAGLNKQLDFLKENNTQALKQLENLSVITSAQAESIKKSLENIGAKDMYIQDLQSAIARKDSLNMALVMNLKGAIGNLDDEDINIKVDKGVVYIDISDKLLFNSGSFTVTSRAKTVLAKVAQVLKNQPGIEFMVEGHTDNVPYKSGQLLDNWDLSVKRATSVVRILQNEYGLDPSQMAAAGRGEYRPLTDNTSAGNRAINRRTRIVILPQLDQFFRLLEPKST